MKKHTVLIAALLVSTAACGKKAPPAEKPKAPEAQPAEAVPAPAAATPVEAAADATPAVDPLKNGWNLSPRGTSAKEGDRIFLLTQGKDRSHTNPAAIYQLFAHDLGEVKGDVATIKELDGSSFQVGGQYIIAAGLKAAADVKAGDMVLAEWASSLKHAIVQKVDGEKITVRYTDLPDSWSEDKLVAVKSPKEVTKQAEGLSPGNFAVAQDDGRPVIVLLVSENGEKWLARKFSGRVATFPKGELQPIPLKPTLKAGQQVVVPYVGMMYQGKVKKVSGTRVEVAIDQGVSKEAIVSSMGQVALSLPPPK
jgi:predicted small lipoprotein YifL